MCSNYAMKHIRNVYIYMFVFTFMLLFVFIIILFAFTLIFKLIFISRSVFLYICIWSEVKMKSLAVEKFMPQVRNFGQVFTQFKQDNLPKNDSV